MPQNFFYDLCFVGYRTHVFHKFNHIGFDVFAHFLFIEPKLVDEMNVVQTL